MKHKWDHLVVATRNQHKVKELDALMKGELGLPVIGLGWTGSARSGGRW